MPKRAKPLEETPGQDILDELLNMVDQRQIIPNEHALFVYMTTVKKYNISLDSFRHYFGRLEKEGHIKVDLETRGVSVLARRIIPIA